MSSPAPLFRQVTVVAPGLLGGSLGLACRRRRLAETVTGAARRPAALEEGLARGIFDRGTTDLEEGVREADLVVIAAPVRATIALIQRLTPFVRADALVTDVGSTKAEIVEVGTRLLGPHRFVGGHPMAGSHETGIGAARENLFEGAPYLLTPVPETPALQVERLEALARGLGARPTRLSPEDHDRLVARISHLPHLAACALVQSAASFSLSGTPALAVAASGFRDTTRVAAGSPTMWADILLTNRGAVLESLDTYLTVLQSLRDELASADEEALSGFLEAARAGRASL